MPAEGPILIAGAGIAGLTAALAFAQRGHEVQVFERADRLEEAGAGIQLSPNATRLLFRLGLRDALLAVAPRPEAVSLVDARNLRELAQVPLGAWGEARWGAPYLTCRRADLQRVLLDAIAADGRISLRIGTALVGAVIAGENAQAVLGGAERETVGGSLLIGADGMHSALRASFVEGGGNVGVVPPLRLLRSHLSPFRRERKGDKQEDGTAPLPPEEGKVGREAGRRGGTAPTGDSSSNLVKPTAIGLTAWRAVVRGSPSASVILRQDRVASFLKPRAHLVAYPTDAGRFNLVAFAATQGPAGGSTDAAAFQAAFADAAPALKKLVANAEWSAWPLLTAPHNVPWTFAGRAALVGDAAHAMTPFAAQGAAMAIEDAWTLAAAFADAALTTRERLARWEAQRRARIAQVVRRGRLNRITWHASGPVALARNLVLRLLPEQKLARDLDWLYGWQPD